MFANVKDALRLVWRTSRPLGLSLLALTVASGLVPAAIAYVAALIVDAVIAGVQSSNRAAIVTILSLVALEGLLVAAAAAAQRAITLCQSLLRAQLTQRVNEMIFEKALTLDLEQFEHAEFYDKLSQVHRGASSRPLSLVIRIFSVAQNGVSLASFAILLIGFSPWTFALMLAAGLPVFAAEAKFSNDAFRMFLWRSPEARLQAYLSTMLVREDYAKEIQLFGLGPLFAQRHRSIYRQLYGEDRALAIRRALWGMGLGLIGTIALYGAYGWIAFSALVATISVGQMTLYLALFRQGQSTLSALLTSLNGVYEDQLYLATLREFLDAPSGKRSGGARQGPNPDDGIRFEHVTYIYPGATRPALQDISLHIQPRESLGLVGENGSGKTTLIKLLTRLYSPSAGRILLDGLDLREWDEAALRDRFGVIFQDFRRYHLSLGENIGAGDARHFTDENRWREASAKAQLNALLQQLPNGYQTQLGTWFDGGRELSGGQWQKVALGRAFMRSAADVVILDEPTAAMDAATEMALFDRLREFTRDRIVILISHRFSTVRQADQIVVLKHGRIIEQGSHDELMGKRTHYSELFAIQAAGYQ